MVGGSVDEVVNDVVRCLRVLVIAKLNALSCTPSYCSAPAMRSPRCLQRSVTSHEAVLRNRTLLLSMSPTVLPMLNKQYQGRVGLRKDISVSRIYRRSMCFAASTSINRGKDHWTAHPLRLRAARRRAVDWPRLEAASVLS